MDPNSAEATRENLRGEEEDRGGQEEDRSTRRLDILKIKVLLEEHRYCIKTTSEVLKLVITG